METVILRLLHPTITTACKHTHTHILKAVLISMRRINVGIFGRKYFWPGSKPSYTRTPLPPYPGHLPLIMSILYEYRPDSHLALLPLLRPKSWWQLRQLSGSSLANRRDNWICSQWSRDGWSSLPVHNYKVQNQDSDDDKIFPCPLVWYEIKDEWELTTAISQEH